MLHIIISPVYEETFSLRDKFILPKTSCVNISYVFSILKIYETSEELIFSRVRNVEGTTTESWVFYQAAKLITYGFN